VIGQSVPLPAKPGASCGPARSPDHVLLERETELGLVTQAVRRAHSGTGTPIVVSGPLGIGKSALLQAFSELGEAEGARVLRASAAPLEREFPFGVVGQLVDLMVPELSTVSDHASNPLLTQAIGAIAAGKPVEDPAALPSTLCAVLEEISAERPLLVLVDDLQWVDAPTLRWLAHLARQVETMRVVLAATVREGEALAGSLLVRDILASAARTLRLSALSRDATHALLRDQLGEPVDKEFVLACHETTNGNPLFLASLLSNLRLSGVRPVAEDAATARSLRPARLRDRLISCLQAQPRPVRESAKAITVLGDDPELELVAELAGLDEVGCAEALRALHRLGLLVTEHEPRFSHPIVQDAVEGCMTVEENDQARARAVRLRYERGSPAEQVATQLLAVTSPQGRWAVETLHAAADTATRRGASEMAARHLRRALLEPTVDGEDRAMVLADLAAAERGSDPSASLRHIAYAVPLFRSSRARAAAVTRIAPVLLEFGVPPSIELTRRAAAELGITEDRPETGSGEGIERDLALRLEARLRHAEHTASDKLADSVRCLRELDPYPSLATGGERELLTVLLHAATLTVGMPSDELARLATRILEHEPASPAHLHTTLPLLVNVLVAADALDALPAWLDMMLDQLHKQHATAAEQALIRAEQAVVLLNKGRHSDARAAAAEVAALGAAESNVFTSKAVSRIGGVAMEVRDGELIDRLVALLQQRDDAVGERPILRRMLWGHAAAIRGDLRLALEHYMDSGRQLNRLGWHNPVLFPWRPFAARLCQHLGDINAARELADENHEVSLAWGSPTAVGRALRLSGRLTEGKEGIALFRQALETLSASVNRLERAKAHLDLGRRLRAAREPGAEEHLSRSCELALGCGVEWLAERARAELGESQLRSRRTDGRTLTSTEHAVAALAADGRTNQEIAAEFGVTARTVEKHLTNSYRKLGVRRRDELAAALRAVSEPDRATGDQR
jgi:DNA-binding CsgD family transcriptional regulator